ncbi:MAG: glycosyltransferase [bacterium]
MIRIGYVIDTIETPSAGTESQLLMLLDGLDRSRFRPYLICLRNSEWLRDRRFEFPSVVYDLKGNLSLSFLIHLRRFRRLIRDEKIDIVQTFFVDGNWFGTIGAHLAKCPVIISSRRNMGDWHSQLKVSLLRFLKKWTTGYLANSEAAAQKTVTAEGVSRDQITVIHNGLNQNRYRSLTDDVRRQQRLEWRVAEDEILIGTVANLRPVKNVASLIRSAATLCRQLPSLKFVVVGDGGDRPQLQDLIDSLSLSDRFHLVGRSTDIPTCLAAFDVAVMCSSFESFSNALIEYMAAGLPIVASDVGGNSEAISHEKNGLLYAVEDKQGLTAGLNRLLTDKELSVRLGQAAKESAATGFRVEACINAHQQFYTDLVKGVRQK